jgi:hypothetical protein
MAATSRARADRQTEERTERRRRSDTNIDGGQRLKLAIPPEVGARLKAEGRTPRWINDEGNRVHNLTRLDDYDKVAGVGPVHVGTGKDGKPIKAHLYSKPAAFIHEDEAKRDERRRETERALLRGKNPEDPIAGDDSFYADPANKIQHGERRSP